MEGLGAIIFGGIFLIVGLMIIVNGINYIWETFLWWKSGKTYQRTKTLGGDDVQHFSGSGTYTFFGECTRWRDFNRQIKIQKSERRVK